RRSSASSSTGSRWCSTPESCNTAAARNSKNSSAAAKRKRKRKRMTTTMMTMITARVAEIAPATGVNASLADAARAHTLALHFGERIAQLRTRRIHVAKQPLHHIRVLGRDVHRLADVRVEVVERNFGFLHSVPVAAGDPAQSGYLHRLGFLLPVVGGFPVDA